MRTRSLPYSASQIVCSYTQLGSSAQTVQNEVNSKTIITSSILHAMLGERIESGHRSKVTRRSTLDHISSPPTSTISPKFQTRRVSLDSMVMTFDGERINTQGNLVECSNSTETSRDSIKFKNNEEVNCAQKDPFHNDEVLKGNSHPNFPHPLIEYLPLYFVLKHFPTVLATINKIYAFRWDLKYPLQRRIPFSKKLRKIGIIATWGELLLWCPFAIILSFGILDSFIYPSVSKSGIVSRVPLVSLMLYKLFSCIFASLPVYRFTQNLLFE